MEAIVNATGRDATGAASEQPWDAVIVGAGPAGSLAAHQLASRGLRTLLVERSAFPRDKVCGGCVGARAVEQLELLGLGHVARGQGGMPIAGLQICRGSRRLAVPLSGGVAISRRAFDAALVDAAVAAGAEFRPETLATVTPAVADPAAGFRQVALRTRGRDAAEIAARVVLVADGLSHSSLRQLPAFESRVAEHARIGLGTVAAASTKDYEPGTIYMAVGRTGYVGVVRVEHDRLNVAAAIDSRFLRQCGGPAAAIATILQQAERPVPAVESSAWQGTPPLTRRTEKLADWRLFVSGDAAGYVEPFTGEGIAWALTAAVAVAPLAEQACTAWDERLVTLWHQRYGRLIRRRQRLCRMLTAVLKHPWAASTAWAGLSMLPRLARPLVHHLERS
jgi:flavin-dependent dehydrogenase